jgi:hypothetical protein
VIDVHHIYYDILHIHLDHPRHDAHDDDGKYDYEPWQERIATYLQELFLYEILEHN